MIDRGGLSTTGAGVGGGLGRFTGGGFKLKGGGKTVGRGLGLTGGRRSTGTGPAGGEDNNATAQRETTLKTRRKGQDSNRIPNACLKSENIGTTAALCLVSFSRTPSALQSEFPSCAAVESIWAAILSPFNLGYAEEVFQSHYLSLKYLHGPAKYIST